MKVRKAQYGRPRHSIPVHAHVHKVGNQFEACVFAGNLGAGGRKGGYACGRGSNPRTAFGKALKGAGLAILKRSGTFGGW